MPNFEQKIWKKLDQKTKPPGSLGKLEILAASIGRIQGTVRPQIVNPCMIIFAGDHGIAAENVSAYPQAVTAQMVRNFLDGGAAISVMARTLGWNLLIVDAGVVSDLPSHPMLRNHKIARGTKNFLYQPAMTEEQMNQALSCGQEIVRELHKNGCSLIGLGEMGIGNSSSASALLGLLLNLSLEQLVGPGTGLNRAGMKHKTQVLKNACILHSETRTEGTMAALAAVGGFEMVMLAGAAREAASRQIPVMVDGLIVTASLLALVRTEPKVREALLFAHRSPEPGHQHALRALSAEPYLDLELRLGEGTGAALLLPLAQAAVEILETMATFESAGIDQSSSS